MLRKTIIAIVICCCSSCGTITDTKPKPFMTHDAIIFDMEINKHP